MGNSIAVMSIMNVHSFKIMTLGNRLQIVVLLSVLLMTIPGWAVCEGNIGGDEAMARQRREDSGSNEDSTTQEGIIQTQCNCTAVGSSSTLTCTTPTTDCESDEVQYKGSCYRFITDTPKTRDESVLDCIERNSHLVYIESREEQDFLAGNASSLGDHDYWIGLLYSVTYVWLNNSPYDPELFTIDSSDGGNCILINSGEFRIRACDKYRYFICESQKTPSGCGDLHEFDDSCYEVEQNINYRTMYDDASQYCTTRGGHLLYIETANELSEVRSQLGLSTNRGYWIGLKVIRYRWMDGSPALFQTFETYNGDDGNECFRMRPGNFNWNDLGCDANHEFICERKISTTPTLISEELAWCLPSIPIDLIRLSHSGSLCIDTGDSSTPILHECDTGDGGDDSVGNAVDECSCFKTTNDDQFYICSCGFCRFTSNVMDYIPAWPSEMMCSCSHGAGRTPFNVTAVDGTFTCSPEGGLPELTEATMTVTDYSSMANTEYTGVAVGVTLALVLLLVALVGCFCWRRKGGKQFWKKSDGSVKTSTPNATAVDLSKAEENPTYGLDEDASASKGIILKPVHGVGVHAVRNPTYEVGEVNTSSDYYTYIKPPDGKQKSNTYADIPSRGYQSYRQNQQPDAYTSLQGTKKSNEVDDPTTYATATDNTGDQESYAEIPSSGYSAYNVKHGNDVYTGLQSTGGFGGDDSDDPLVYTPKPDSTRNKPTKKPKGDVDLLDGEPPRGGAHAGPAPSARSMSNDYEDVDATKPKDALTPSGKPTVPSKKPSGSTGYVSVDAPYSIGNHTDGDLNQEDSYNFKQQKPKDATEYVEQGLAPLDDHTYGSLSVNARNLEGKSDTQVPDNDTYNIIDRTLNKHTSPTGKEPPARENIDIKTNVRDNAYDAFNRTGMMKHQIGTTDDGDYSLTVAPGGDTYNSFDRTNIRNPRLGDSENDYGSVMNTDDSEYATLD